MPKGGPKVELFEVLETLARGLHEEAQEAGEARRSLEDWRGLVVDAYATGSTVQRYELTLDHAPA